MIWACLLVFIAVGLEALTQSPFLATRFGVLFGLFLGGGKLEVRLYGHLYRHLYCVAKLPAFGFRAAAQTWGETVLVVPELRQHPRCPAVLAHEACHVTQYRRYTSLGFWLRYLGEWLCGLVRTRDFFRAYAEISLEREARNSAP